MISGFDFFGLAAAGFFIGIIGSMLGIGGGIFAVPILVLYFKIPAHQAVAASLMAIIAVSSAAAAVNVERGLVNMPVGIVLELSTAVGSIAGAVVSNLLSAQFVERIFAAVAVPAAGLMIIKGLRKKSQTAVQSAEGELGYFGASFFDPAEKSQSRYRVKNMNTAFFTSFFAGSLSGLIGIGGGIIHVPVMTGLCRMPMKAAAATSNFMIGVSAAASLLVFYRNGMINPEITAGLSLGIMAGAAIGINILYHSRSERLQVLFGILLLIIAARMAV